MPGDRRAKSNVSLGGGRTVPYPEPTSPAATKIAKANRRVDTLPEVRLRSALHQRGLRFRKDYRPEGVTGLRSRIDIAFTRARLAVFVDGCFWHSCPVHRSTPKSNEDYWIPKLAANVERDGRVTRLLEASGWEVLRIWEHEEVEAATDQVARALQRRTER